MSSCKKKKQEQRVSYKQKTEGYLIDPMYVFIFLCVYVFMARTRARPRAAAKK
jgi:hypothetical protein